MFPILAKEMLPPAMTYGHADLECGLDYLANDLDDDPADAALSNSRGLRSTNTTLVFKHRSR